MLINLTYTTSSLTPAGRKEAEQTKDTHATSRAPSNTSFVMLTQSDSSTPCLTLHARKAGCRSSGSMRVPLLILLLLPSIRKIPLRKCCINVGSRKASSERTTSGTKSSSGNWSSSLKDYFVKIGRRRIQEIFWSVRNQSTGRAHRWKTRFFPERIKELSTKTWRISLNKTTTWFSNGYKDRFSHPSLLPKIGLLKTRREKRKTRSDSRKI